MAVFVVATLLREVYVACFSPDLSCNAEVLFLFLTTRTRTLRPQSKSISRSDHIVTR